MAMRSLMIAKNECVHSVACEVYSYLKDVHCVDGDIEEIKMVISDKISEFFDDMDDIDTGMDE